MRLLVVGAGEMGRWFAEASGATDVAFADRDEAVAREAAAALEATPVALNTDERFDVVCVAVPMSAVPEAIATHAPKATAAIVDVSGEMRESVNALSTHADGRAYASFHPLFSASNAPGNIPVVVGDADRNVASIRASLESAGNAVFETTPDEHDRAMETVQARAHTAILAYALAAEPIDERFHTSLSEPLSELVDGVTQNTPEVYAEIQRRFSGADSVADAARQLAEADAETFERLYEKAGRSQR